MDGNPGRVVPRPSAASEGPDAQVPQPRTTRRAPSRQQSDVLPDNVTATPSPGSPSALTTPSDSASASAISPVQVAAPAATAPAVIAVNTLAPPAATGLTGILDAPVPPALLKPLANISAAVTRIFDSAANLIDVLPGGPISELLEGALLLIRRTFFNLFPMLNVGQTVGQSTATSDPAYFTEAELRAYLLELAEQQYGGLFGQTVPVYGYGWGPYPEYLKADSGIRSDTNTQVEGVDEADFVENDGQYIYSAHNGQLTIVRADDLSVVSQSTLTGNVMGQYLAGDRLTVISQTGSGWWGPMVRMAYPGFWGPWNPQTTVTVYDVTDRAAPTVVNQTVFDGAYQSSRSVDGMVYVVMQRSVNLPAPKYTETPVPPRGTVDGPEEFAADRLMKPYPGGEPIAYRTYETWDEYVARVGDDIVDLSLPHAYSVDAEGNTVDLGLVAAAGEIVKPHADNQQSVLTVVSVDSGGQSGGSSFGDSVGAMVSAEGSTVYMTQGALYVATAEGRYTDSGFSTDTRIDRFVVTGPDIDWQATGLVSGTLINQFAMDERNGYLRVATHTLSTQWGAGVTTTRNDSGIYVLDTAGNTLDEVGRLTGLAPGEDLYAVRYVGDMAYLVTFLRTDPLFAIDMSDPTQPVLLGELVIPGFSNYLQSVGDGLLLGIGQEREEGSWNTHVHASLFDVSDGASLTQIEREFLDPGYQWSWSDAQFDHHALLYSEEDGLLVVPVSGSGYDPQTGYKYGQYLKVLRVGPTGIEVIGEIHTAEPTLRTVRIGDVLYAVGDSGVTAYRLSDLSEIGRSAAAPSVV